MFPPKFPPLRLKQTASALLMLAGLLFTGVAFRSHSTSPESEVESDCLEVLSQDTRIDTKALDSLDKRSNETRQTLQKSLGQPYCFLPKTSLRAGAITERAVYRLPNDGRAILAFENDRLVSYGREPVAYPPARQKEVELKKSWDLQAGSAIGDGYRIASGLGDLSIEMDGEVYAPASGVAYGRYATISQGELTHSDSACLLFESPQFPGYLLQLCGLEKRRLGAVEQAERLGRVKGYLHLSLLRRDGAWVFVPPSEELLSQLLREP